MPAGYRHVYLLGSLVLLLLAHPFLAEQLVRFALVDAFIVLTVGTGVLACATTRRQAVIGVALAAAMQIAQWSAYFTDNSSWFTAYLGIALLFFGYVVILMLRDVFLQTSRVSADTICGAVSVYLLLGLVWAFAYALLEVVEPVSFSFGGAAISRASFERFFGFSFVTLTTLGYGNVVPMTPKADALAITQAMVGQIYLTVLVARLVALHLTQAKEAPAVPTDDSRPHSRSG